MAEESTAMAERSADNTIYVGKKDTMAYVLAVVTQMNQGMNEVVIKARGKAISRAVDVAEIVKNKFSTDARIESIITSTEEVESDEGKSVKVSAIEIRVVK